MGADCDLPVVGEQLRLLKPCGDPGPVATVAAIARETTGLIWIVCELDQVPYRIAVGTDGLLRIHPAASTLADPGRCG